MTEKQELAQTNDAAIMENVLLGGDLSKLTPAQRVSYYMKICDKLGLNPLTRPFDYINLKGKLTLYAKKDATDQLRNLHGVSIDDVDITENDKQFIVKVKGHDKTGRSDVELGVVNKTDMQGDLANAQMKAVTKGKRRLTLSLCGLGFLDETEISSIPDAQPVLITEEGVIETPIQKAIRMYGDLCLRADAVKIPHESLAENVTIDQARAQYKELAEYVKNAEEQATAEQPS